jgi:hypothetical protein
VIKPTTRPAKKAPGILPKPSQGHNGKGDHGKQKSDEGVHRPEIDQQCAGDGYGSPTHTPGQSVHSFGGNTHVSGPLCIQGCRGEGLTHFGAIHQQPDRKKGRHRKTGRRQFGGGHDDTHSQMEAFAHQEPVCTARSSDPKDEKRQVSSSSMSPNVPSKLRHHGSPQQKFDKSEIADDTQHKIPPVRLHRQGEKRINPKTLCREKPGIHTDHQKFAMSEIDDIHHTENDGQPQSHQRQDHADEQSGKK